jgi:putative hydrolase of the HAD superfamily
MPLEQPQSIRTIFFDAGFTLLHPNPSTPEICQRICRQLDLHIDLDKLHERVTEADDFFYSQTRQRRHLWASEDAINTFWIDYYTNFLSDDDGTVHILFGDGTRGARLPTGTGNVVAT